MKEHNVRPENLEIALGNTGKTFEDIGIGNHF
jgi:hypothetical protein